MISLDSLVRILTFPVYEQSHMPKNLESLNATVFSLMEFYHCILLYRMEKTRLSVIPLVLQISCLPSLPSTTQLSGKKQAESYI